MFDLFILPLVIAASAAETGDEAGTLETVTVTARRVANLQPAASFSAAATELRFDPQINLQARGLPEGQADITVRGGLFENTGFRLGAVTVLDPQTGHYAVEIPVDPAMLTTPEVLTDFDNGLNAFNASVATLSYGFSTVSDGGGIAIGAGSDSLLYGSARASRVRRNAPGATLGATISAAASRGDGTLADGDHEFKRFSAHLQRLAGEQETNLLIGYLDKFAGWPGMYTGFASLPETDHTKLGLALLDHRWANANGWWQAGIAYRWLEDDYDFDRRTQESGTPGSFEHETRVFSAALAGMQRFAGLDWHLNGQLTADRLVRSTDLTHGHFNSRSYGSLGVAPGREWRLAPGATAALRAGLRADFSNREENALAPMFALSLKRQAGAATERWELDYARTTQLPGYTALNSRPAGLFGGNPDLDREFADTLTLGWTRETAVWAVNAALFHRRDSDLVDWTFRQGAPFVRQANPVDIDVTGFEAYARWHTETLELIGGYAWLNKDEDYGGAGVDASYYALNYAKHRVTLAAVWKPVRSLAFRLDNEYRVHEENALRSSDDNAFLASLSATWQPSSIPALALNLVADNLTDSDFQEFPGTPPVGRQLSLGLAWDW